MLNGITFVQLSKIILILGKTVSECIIDRYESDGDDDEKTIEEKIYGGFYSNEDKSILEEFQLGSWDERLNLLSRFSDERLKQLGRRLIAFNAPELLTTNEQDAFDAYLKNKWETENEKAKLDNNFNNKKAIKRT